MPTEEETQEFDETTGEFFPAPTPGRRNENDTPQSMVTEESQAPDTTSGDKNKEKLTVFVTTENGETLQYKIFNTAPMNVLMTNACLKLKINESDVSFMYNGTRLKGEDTAKGLNIKESEEIEIVPNSKATKALKPSKETDTDKIQITVSIDNREIHFRQSKTSDFKKLFRVACEQFGINQAQVAFCFDGERITSTKTPADLSMDEEFARIEIFQRQRGGNLT